MGALTFKPLAFRFRPWEVTPTEVFNHVEGTGRVVFHLRGGKVLKITSPGWLRDRTRFSYDGFRRQRLVTPLVGTTPVGWPTGVAAWLSLLVEAPRVLLRVDPIGGVHLFWLLRVYHTFSDGRGQPLRVGVDVNTKVEVYHGAFGLPGVTTAVVALPGCLPYEADGVVTPPVGSTHPWGLPTLVTQLLSREVRPYRWGCPATPGDNTPRVETHALFQVSPLQGLLPGW